VSFLQGREKLVAERDDAVNALEKLRAAHATMKTRAKKAEAAARALQAKIDELKGLVDKAQQQAEQAQQDREAEVAKRVAECGVDPEALPRAATDEDVEQARNKAADSAKRGKTIQIQNNQNKEK
jgi:hypothetical protein